jgi:hypothetical protein
MVLTLVVLLFLVSCKEKPGGSLHLVGADKTAVAPSGQTCLVVAVHGWIKKGKGGWPEQAATAMHERVDANDWLCGYFDWPEGARTFRPMDAAAFAQEFAGSALAGEILKLDKDFKHIHLLGHSSGCWAISEAAKELASKTNADIHLTFFDAYVPLASDPNLLADVNATAGVNVWADHYYTRDYTFAVTQRNLKFAHNVDLTELDGLLKDHNFPWQWYLATVCGEYPKGSVMNQGQPNKNFGGIEYGFARSKQGGKANGWAKSLELEKGTVIQAKGQSTKSN